VAVEVWFVNGQSVELDIGMNEASEAMANAAAGAHPVDQYTQPRAVAVAWAHVTHAKPSSQRPQRALQSH
jgi:hypothetical protein